MFLRRISGGVKNQDWFVVMVEIMIVLVGLFIGLLVNTARAEQSGDDSLPELVVYGNDYPPYFYESEDGTAEGEWVTRIRAFLDQSELEYSISVVPWSRAYLAGTTKHNVLIAHLDRTDEREEQFHWLFPLVEKTNQLIARSDSEYVGRTKSEILNGDGMATCLKQSIQCDMLAQFGFPEDRIWTVADYSKEPLASLILRGRVDFWLDDFEIISRIWESYGGNSADFKPLFEVNTVTGYVVASKTIDPRLLEHLLSVMDQN